MANLNVTQENLAKGLSIVSRAVATHSPLPVLGNILLSTDEGGRLRLAATNLELSILCWIGAKIETPLSTTLPAKTLVDLVGTLPEGRIDIGLDAKTQTTRLSCGRVKANVKGIDAQEFPLIPSADLSRAVEFSAADLRQMIDEVIFAVATDQARPILTGALVKLEGDIVVLVASDGFRLTVRAARLAKPVPSPVALLIPGRGLNELRRLLITEEPVFMCLPEGRGQVIFHHDSVELVSQLIDGAFPEYANIIPRRYATRAVLKTAEFRKACKSTDIFAREAAHTARFKVTPGADEKQGRLTISATAAETGDNVTSLDATVEGEAVETAFNVKYILEALNAISAEEVALETTAPNSPGVLKPVGRDDYLCVVMPMQLGGNSAERSASGGGAKAPAVAEPATPVSQATPAASAIPATTAA